jgi:hypothetical protein
LKGDRIAVADGRIIPKHRKPAAKSSQNWSLFPKKNFPQGKKASKCRLLLVAYLLLLFCKSFE